MSEAEKQKRKNEIFKRINSRSLARWIKDSGPSELIYDLIDEVNDENCFQGNTRNGPVMSTISGNIENLKNKGDVYDSKKDEKFLLLDLRTTEKYETFRIKESVSFPGRLINQDKYPSDLYSFKNRPNKWIVIYGDDDKIIEPIGDLLVKKGIENIIMLTGGIGKFCLKHEDLIEGKVPQDFLDKIDPEILCLSESGISSFRNNRDQISISMNSKKVNHLFKIVLERTIF